MKELKEMGFWETLKNIPNRIVSLVFNLISRWGIMLVATTGLIFLDKLTSWETIVAWIIFSMLFLFKTDGIEMIEKVLDAIGRLRKGE